MRRYWKGSAACLALGLILAGCGQAKGESASCSAEFGGLSTKFTFSAPAADQDVNHLSAQIELPQDFLGADLSNEEEKAQMDAQMDTLKTDLASSMQMDPEKLEITSDENGLTVKIEADTPEEIRRLFEMGEDQSLKFEDVKKTLDESGLGGCE